MNRSKEIIRTSVIGIVANVLLASFKAVVGLLAHSVVPGIPVSIIIDHNYSD